MDWRAKKSIHRVRELRAEGTTTVDEINLPGDSTGNGIIERAILTVGGLVRSTKAVVEEKVVEGRSAGQRPVAGMVHHAAQVSCTCMVAADGLTLFRLLKGTSSAHRWQISVTAWLRDPILGKSKLVQPEVHRGEVARILPQVVPLHRGRF